MLATSISMSHASPANIPDGVRPWEVSVSLRSWFVSPSSHRLKLALQAAPPGAMGHRAFTFSRPPGTCPPPSLHLHLHLSGKDL